MRRFSWLWMVLVLASVLPAQETGSSLVAAGRKKAQEATGKSGPDRDQILAEAVRILQMVPERFGQDATSCARAFLEMGRLHRRMGAVAESEAALKKVLDHPTEERVCCDALHELATLYRKAKKMDEAKAALQQIIERYATQPSERASALIRLAGLHRDAKHPELAEECLRQALKEHGDLWRSAVEALDDLVALKLKAKEYEEARKVLDTHTEALKARFAGTADEERLERALGKMATRAKLDAGRAPAPPVTPPAPNEGEKEGNPPRG